MLKQREEHHEQENEPGCRIMAVPGAGVAGPGAALVDPAALGTGRRPPLAGLPVLGRGHGETWELSLQAAGCRGVPDGDGRPRPRADGERLIVTNRALSDATDREGTGRSR